MNAMVLLSASTIALLLGVAVMPWRTLGPSRNTGFVVTVVAGCTFMGIGFGGMTFGVLILLIQ